MELLQLRALIAYQELCPDEPEKESSRGEALEFNNFRDLTQKIMNSPSLKIHHRILFKALDGSEIISTPSSTDGEITRKFQENKIEYVLKIKISLQQIKWENL